MFRRLIMAILRLYMKYLLRSYTNHTWAVYMLPKILKANVVSVHAMKACGLVEVWLHSFLTRTIDGGERSDTSQPIYHRKHIIHKE